MEVEYLAKDEGLIVWFKKVVRTAGMDIFTAKNRGLSIFGKVSRSLKQGQGIWCFLAANCAKTHKKSLCKSVRFYID
jgi:hypothetical protein